MITLYNTDTGEMTQVASNGNLITDKVEAGNMAAVTSNAVSKELQLTYSTDNLVFSGVTYVHGGYCILGNICFVQLEVKGTDFTRWQTICRGFPSSITSQQIVKVSSYDDSIPANVSAYINRIGDLIILNTFTKSDTYPISIFGFYLVE